jgi:hypothetical protein
MGKLIKKGYEARVSWQDNKDDFEIFHADDAQDAKKTVFGIWEEHSIPYIDIRVCRNKQFDLLENTPHAIVGELTQRQIELMLHTSGLSDSYYSYRNYYYITSGDSSELDDLVLKQLMTPEKTNNGTYYYLTTLGFEVIRSTKPIQRQHIGLNLFLLSKNLLITEN